jgi:hypothetical protein
MTSAAQPVPPAPEVPSPEPLVPAKPTMAELVRQLQALPTYEARKEFYKANKALRGLIDPCNYSA